MIKAVIFDMYETLISHYRCPLYFSSEMSRDAGIKVEDFLPLWKQTEVDRWIGKYTFEETIEMIMRENHCFSQEKLDLISEKRMATKVEVFENLHEDLLSMLDCLKEKGIQIGLISNCFSEEVIAIRNSVLAPYFDCLCLSYELGVRKPEDQIYLYCMDALNVRPEECLYVGDGGCQELETALRLGLHPLQAAWYFQDGLEFQSKRNPEFTQLEHPFDVLKFLY